ncbi:MAG TPA: amidase [Terracidiphilus sp.]|nr:amidase [Terracidiphilus sp.]
MSDIVLQSASRQLALLQAGEISVVELAEAHLKQIARLEPKLNAFADFDAERVRAEAMRLDESKEPRGPLHGLPVTVKSSIAVRGLRCEVGSMLNKGHVPREDAVAVARSRAAGALILGTTNCPEFLMAYETDNLLHGRVCNPWDLERTPGGSSGGESAAIAAGMSAAGLGSDSGGSVRVPAHFTGICSFKPTPGRFPARGHLPPCVGPFSVLGAIGPMARTMEDVSLLFRVLGGQDLQDPVSVPVKFQELTLDELRSTPVGFFEDDGLVPVTAETRNAVQAAVSVLRSAGFRVEAIRPRMLEPLRRLWWKLFVQCGAMFYEPMIRGRKEKLSPIFREFLEIAGAVPPVTAAQLLDAWAELDVLRAKALAEMDATPVWLCPVASVPAIKHGERSWNIDGETVSYLDAVRHTQWFNTLAAPAAVTPAGCTPEGLPIGVQVVARPFEDERALGVAAIVNAELGCRVPPMAVGTHAG